MVLKMKLSFSSSSRAIGVGVATVGLCSCSLFKNGKYASQWEIQTDVPASLNSGQATVPRENSLAFNNVRSNLSGAQSPAVQEAGMLDLPGENAGPIIDLPKPDPAMLNPLQGQSRVEMLNLPGGGISTDLPAAAVGSLDTASTLLNPPPPVLADEELAAVPSALPPLSPAMVPDSIPGEPSLKPAAEDIPMGISEGKSPVKTAAAPSIPLLYGKLDLAPFLPLASEATSAPEASPGE